MIPSRHPPRLHELSMPSPAAPQPKIAADRCGWAHQVLLKGCWGDSLASRSSATTRAASQGRGDSGSSPPRPACVFRSLDCKGLMMISEERPKFGADAEILIPKRNRFTNSNSPLELSLRPPGSTCQNFDGSTSRARASEMKWAVVPAGLPVMKVETGGHRSHSLAHMVAEHGWSKSRTSENRRSTSSQSLAIFGTQENIQTHKWL